MKLEISGRGINNHSKYYYKRLMIDIYDRYKYNLFLPEEIEDLLEIGSLSLRMTVMKRHKLLIPDRTKKRFSYHINNQISEQEITDTKKCIILEKLKDET